MRIGLRAGVEAFRSAQRQRVNVGLHVAAEKERRAIRRETAPIAEDAGCWKGKVGDFFQLSIGNVNARYQRRIEHETIHVKVLRIRGPRGVVHFRGRDDGAIVGSQINQNQMVISGSRLGGEITSIRRTERRKKFLGSGDFFRVAGADVNAVERVVLIFSVRIAAIENEIAVR